MEGGKILYSGRNSCVFKPNVPCNRNEKVNKQKITKVLFNYPGGEKRELTMGDHIKKIKGYQSWAVTFDSHCPSLPTP